MRRAAAILVVLGAVLLSTAAWDRPAASDTPAPQAAGVDHVVVLMQENRSADHYLGQLRKAGQPDFEAEPATGNPDPLHPGKTILPFHKTTLCEPQDLSHSWN